MTHLVCLGFCRDETLPVLLSEVKLSLHFHSESCSCIHPKHRGLECRQQGPPADAGPGLDHTAAQQFSPAGSSPPLRVPGAESCGGGGLSGRICPQPLPCWRVQGWDASAQGLPTAGEGQGLRRASGPLGIVVLGVPRLRLNVAQVWCFQACLQLEIMLISHTCSFFRALED